MIVLCRFRYQLPILTKTSPYANGVFHWHIFNFLLVLFVELNIHFYNLTSIFF